MYVASKYPMLVYHVNIIRCEYEHEIVGTIILEKLRDDWGVSKNYTTKIRTYGFNMDCTPKFKKFNKCDDESIRINIFN